MRRDDMEAGILAAVSGDREATELFLAQLRREEDERLRHTDPAEWYRRRFDTSRWPWPLRIERAETLGHSQWYAIQLGIDVAGEPLRVRFAVDPDNLSAELMLLALSERAERLWQHAYRVATRCRDALGAERGAP